MQAYLFSRPETIIVDRIPWKMKIEVWLVFRVLLITTPISYVASALSGVKVNYFFLLMLFICSVHLIYKKNKGDFIFLAIACFPAILMYIFNSFGLNAYLAFIMGFSAFFAAFSGPGDNSFSHASKAFFRRCFVVISCSFILLVYLQYLNLIPVVFLNLKLENLASNYFLSGGSLYVRPNGYFYHPYELCLFLTGLLLYLYKTNRMFSMVFVYAPLSLIVFVKSWLMACFFLIGSLLVKRLNKNWVLRFYYLLVGAVFIIFVVDMFSQYGDSFLSGRINLWQTYLAIYGENYTIKNYLLGPDFHPLQNSYLWSSEYVPGAHNQVISFVVFWGFLPFLCGAIFFLRFVLKYKEIIKDELFFIFAIFITLGMSGEPLSVPLMWIAFASARMAVKV